MSRLLVRRSATALGIYSSFAFGLLGTVAATRELPTKHAVGAYTTVFFATGFLQSFFDLSAEEALVKYGFRYVTREEWGRLAGLFWAGTQAKLVGSALGAIGLLVFAAFAHGGLVVPLLLAAGIPLGQSLEGLAGIPLYLHGRYDLRAGFQSWSMLLRMVGILVGAHYGVAQAIAGVLVAQVAATGSIGIAGMRAFRRFPSAPRLPLADDRRDVLGFVAQSSVSTGVLSLRVYLAPLLLVAVAGNIQGALFKIGQAPQTFFGTLSAPFRMVLLTEQTSAWEQGRQASVLRGVRRYTLAAFALSCVAVIPLEIWIPDVIRTVNGARWVDASNAARIFILAAALQLVVGWSKSFAVSIGRPELRTRTNGLEAIVVLALVVPLGALWGAAGAAGAMLAGSLVYAVAWLAIAVRIVPEDGVAASEPEGAAEIEAEVGVLAR